MFKRSVVLLCVVISFVFSVPSQASETSVREVSVDQLKKVLLTLPWSISDHEEKAPAREARALKMSQALVESAKEELSSRDRRALIAAVVSIWWSETRFSHEVHRGEPSRWGSDDGRAKCFGQLHVGRVGIQIQEGETLQEFRVRQHEAWQALAGTDFEATKRCAEATMKAFKSSLSLCRSSKRPWVSAFGEYGAGDGSCRELPQSPGRYRLALKIAAKL